MFSVFQVTGLLTVEFLFKDSPFPSSAATTQPAGHNQLQLSSKPTSKPGGIMKNSSGDVGGEQSLTSVEYRKVGTSKAVYNPYLPYDDNYTSTTSTITSPVTQPSLQQNLLAPPPSRPNSRGRQTTFTEPGSLTAGTRETLNNIQTGRETLTVQCLTLTSRKDWCVSQTLQRTENLL